MSSPRFFQMLRRVARRYLDDFVVRAGATDKRTAQVYVDDAPLVPDAPGPNDPTTCPCGRYRKSPGITAVWMTNPATRELDLRPRLDNHSHVTPDELVRWQTEPQAPCTDSSCPHFHACRNTGGDGATMLTFTPRSKNGPADKPPSSNRGRVK